MAPLSFGVAKLLPEGLLRYFAPLSSGLLTTFPRYAHHEKRETGCWTQESAEGVAVEAFAGGSVREEDLRTTPKSHDRKCSNCFEKWRSPSFRDDILEASVWSWQHAVGHSRLLAIPSVSGTGRPSNPTFHGDELFWRCAKRFVRHWARKKAFGKIHRLPNRKLRLEDFHLGRSKNGTYALMQPYPPRVNFSIPFTPDSAKRFYPANKVYPLRWKNIEYRFVPKLVPRPRGATGAWGGEVERIVHEEKTKGRLRAKLVASPVPKMLSASEGRRLFRDADMGGVNGGQQYAFKWN